MAVIYYFQDRRTAGSYRVLCQEVSKRRSNSKRSIVLVWDFCLFAYFVAEDIYYDMQKLSN